MIAEMGRVSEETRGAFPGPRVRTLHGHLTHDPRVSATVRDRCIAHRPAPPRARNDELAHVLPARARLHLPDSTSLGHPGSRPGSVPVHRAAGVRATCAWLRGWPGQPEGAARDMPEDAAKLAAALLAREILSEGIEQTKSARPVSVLCPTQALDTRNLAGRWDRCSGACRWFCSQHTAHRRLEHQTLAATLRFIETRRAGTARRRRRTPGSMRHTLRRSTQRARSYPARINACSIRSPCSSSGISPAVPALDVRGHVRPLPGTLLAGIRRHRDQRHRREDLALQPHHADLAQGAPCTTTSRSSGMRRIRVPVLPRHSCVREFRRKIRAGTVPSRRTICVCSP